MAFLETVFYHMVLPYHVPGRQDANIDRVHHAVATRLIHACETLIGMCGEQDREKELLLLRSSMKLSHDVNLNHSIATSTKDAFQQLQSGQVFTMHVEKQNAAILVWHSQSDESDEVVFEAFEASVPSQDILAAKNALRRCFPDRAVQIPLHIFLDGNFQQALATFLEQASLEALDCFAASSLKARVDVTEVRNTTDPTLITQMLMSLLEGLGRPLLTTELYKRIRDEVNIQDAELPWRRLPYWLVLRVSAQRQLELVLGRERGYVYYKLLICCALGQLLDECKGNLSQEMVLTLQAKLCRRMAKLESMRTKLSSHALSACSGLIDSLSKLLQTVVTKVKDEAEQMWGIHKTSVMRPVPRLSRYAGEGDLRMTLPNCGKYLDNILFPVVQMQKGSENLSPYHVIDYATQKARDFIDRYIDLATTERNIMQRKRPEMTTGEASEARCVDLARHINELLTSVEDAYRSNSEQMSMFILTLFDVWVEMDKHATNVCPLLLEYHPAFDPELLDVLQLPTLSDMERLATIQDYLKARCEQARHKTTNILSEAGQEGFSARYVSSSELLQNLQLEIEEASASEREKLKGEWDKASKAYDDRTQKISESVCTCSTNHDGTRNVQGCRRCWNWRCRKRIDVRIHEAFLPEERVRKSAVIFELGTPTYLAAYRDATWRLIRDVGIPESLEGSQKAVMLLKDYSKLSRYMSSSIRCMSLASMKKSFLQTHYKTAKMKVGLAKILLPHAADYSLYDLEKKVWIKDHIRLLTFRHVCGVQMPKAINRPVGYSDWSSYDIIASQTECPSEMSIHEFLAYQNLASGVVRRWPSILVELCSSNLNFSNEDTVRVITQLAIQAGPRTEKSTLRDIHAVFGETLFRHRLIEQITERLGGIRSSWRETYCLEILITLALRLHTLSDKESAEPSLKFLKACRIVALGWVSRLRRDIRLAQEASVADKLGMYALQAALLCRRTFAVYQDTMPQAMDAEDLASFVQASVVVQETLVADPQDLAPLVKHMYIRDLKLLHRIRTLVRQSLQLHSDVLGAAIARLWAVNESVTAIVLSKWTFLSAPDDDWAFSYLESSTGRFTFRQIVHFNFAHGHLLVDRKPPSRLPPKFKESNDVRELFNDQHLLTFPSHLPDMTYKLVSPIQSNEIHFGLRDDRVVIRALRFDVSGQHALYEFVPHRVFKTEVDSDLPSGLIDNCTHWLNLDTHCLEIRRQPVLWRKRPRDWVLDVVRRRARRGNVSLVDPFSGLGRSVSELFRGFELPERLTIYQPRIGGLSVELRHLELSFFVNKDGLLQCRELHAEMDPDQDAGTFHGFQSHIVLRDVFGHRQRSVIFPLGALVWQRHKMHVTVQARSSNEYGKYEIDNVLGRLTCPPELKLLYSQAMVHALTSFSLPDALTGRTGVEEALSILKSGSAQPWSPLSDVLRDNLRAIAALSPRREFYPKDKRHLQAVIWDAALTFHIQHDCYEPVVQEILRKSKKLDVLVSREKSSAVHQGSSLRSRSEHRRLLYERVPFEGREMVPDATYESVNYRTMSVLGKDVYRIAKVFQAYPLKLELTRPLRSIIESWQEIAGFSETDSVVSYSLIDLIQTRLSEQWGSLVNFCRSTDADNIYAAIFRLSILCFGPEPDMNAIRYLIALVRLEELKRLSFPPHSRFLKFKSAETPSLEVLQRLIRPAYTEFRPTEKQKKKLHTAAQNAHHLDCEAEGLRFARFVARQWPNPTLSIQDFRSVVIDSTIALENMLPEWNRLRRNLEFSEYIDQFEAIVNGNKGSENILMPHPPIHRDKSCLKHRFSGAWRPIFLSNMTLSSSTIQSPTLMKQTVNPTATKSKQAVLSEGIIPRTLVELEHIFRRFSQSQDAIRHQYGQYLDNSLAALRRASHKPKETVQRFEVTSFDVENAQEAAKTQFKQIQLALSADDERFQWCQLGNIWPATTPVTVLQLLRSTAVSRLGAGLKRSIVLYGVLITKLQQLRRVRCALVSKDNGTTSNEWEVSSRSNWDPMKFPDWLLLEIDSNILIRPEQVDVCHAIMSPASGRNSVLQMNMGKGKTSCIVPMAMAALADGKNLARLVVPKALLLQTAQIIQSTLGRLAGRSVKHIPFSRRSSTTPDFLELYSDLHLELLESRGVVLTTPEHILSYKLGGLQMLADSKLTAANAMFRFQSYLNKTCRDVLDESDFSLAVKTQLIYPSGDRLPVDGYPHRWQVSQLLLSFVVDHLSELENMFPASIEVVRRSTSYPFVYFLRSDVEESLKSLIMDDICYGRASLLCLADQYSDEVRSLLREVLSAAKLEPEKLQLLSSYSSDKDSAQKVLLLIRGILQHGILTLCLKKRWNVQYGLHPQRPPVAVPFEAKGVPSEQAEFGHPDVAILLTCLSFYYSGLSLIQFREGLLHLLKSADPVTKFDKWTSLYDTMPAALKHWKGINVEDHGQVEDLWKYLRLDIDVLDYYMNHFVFPLHARQSSVKLQASSWDIPLFADSGADMEYKALSTGFSGTNDNRTMLPLTVQQDDLPDLLHTNAEVLSYLLHDRNRNYYTASYQGRRLTEVGLVEKIAHKGIRILIDAGAYILSLSNQDLVKLWLEKDTQAKAAVFFGKDNRAWVQYRGVKDNVPLVATPYSQDLSECLVYLDEAHTRGVDLKLPREACGALTLALSQTKDHTLQAAMRLRQLGSTQSVAFFAPTEVQQSITDVCGLSPEDNIDSAHVITWLLEQTCRANEQLRTLHLAQGSDFCRRLEAQWRHTDLTKDEEQRVSLLKVIQHEERKTIEELYGQTRPLQLSVTDICHPVLRDFAEKIACESRLRSDTSELNQNSVLEEVEQEQEQEVFLQVEEVRTVERPRRYRGLEYPGLHQSIRLFAETGLLPDRAIYQNAFESLAGTNIGQKYSVHGTKSRIYVSTEFSRTIVVPGRRRVATDDFLRPVEWILWHPLTETILIVNPEEAEQLILLIRGLKQQAKVHLVAYAAPITKSMLSFSNFTYYAIPELPQHHRIPDKLVVELGIFAGRLYIDFDEYRVLSGYLQQTQHPRHHKGQPLDGHSLSTEDGFTANPVGFLLEWLALRRKTQEITHTPVGYVCCGRRLYKGHPFFGAAVDGDIVEVNHDSHDGTIHKYLSGSECVDGVSEVDDL